MDEARVQKRHRPIAFKISGKSSTYRRPYQTKVVICRLLKRSVSLVYVTPSSLLAACNHLIRISFWSIHNPS